MPIRLIRAADLYDGALYAYTAAATIPAREFVFTAGACPVDAAGTVVAPGDVAGQARQAVANIASALDAAGASLTDVLKTTIYVASHQRAESTRWTGSSELAGAVRSRRRPGDEMDPFDSALVAEASVQSLDRFVSLLVARK